MEEHDDLERRKRAAFRRLGTDEPRCVTCGEDDWRCLELHHVAGRAYSPITAIHCCNCHRKQSDPSANRGAPADPPLLERIGRFLLGLAALLAMLADQLKAMGGQLLEAARDCPRPYGWAVPMSLGG
jgi:hypothetical protein